jgi:hypothetical protein
MNLLQEYLLEQALLNESLDSSYDFYKDKLSREQFDKLIALDPTFEVLADRVGTYGKWIIKTFLKGDLKEEDFPRTTEILDDYHNRKRYITTPNGKDIGSYKNLDEIRAALDTIELTVNQREKLRRKQKQHADLGEQAEFLFETDKWEVWHPKTYPAAMKLGAGSSWCTASSGDRGERYFHDYTDRWTSYYSSNRGEECGELFVFNNKKDRNEKYQLQVVKKTDGSLKSNYFMNINDSPYDFLSFLIEEDLIDELEKTRIGSMPIINDARNVINQLKSSSISVKRLGDINHRETYILGSSGSEKIKLDSDVIKKYKIKQLNILGPSEGAKTERGYLTKFDFEVVKFALDYDIKEIPESLFKDCKKLKTVVLPNSIEIIREDAFKNCVNLGELFLPDSLKYISLGAFENCRNVALVMNKRDKKNPLRVTREDSQVIKNRLRVIEPTKSDPAEEAPVVKEAILNEVFSESMPDWLKSWLRKNKSNTNLDAQKLRIRLTGEGDSSGYLEQGELDLKNATFVSAEVPKNARSEFIKSPYLPIFKLTYTHYSNGNSVTDVYIPGVNDNVEPEWDMERKTYGRIAKSTILQHTVAFCYVDLSKPENFSSEKKKIRKDTRVGYIQRITPDAAKRFYGGSENIDKSGYFVDPNILLTKLRQYAKENYSKVIKNLYNRINVVRKELRDLLMDVNIKEEGVYDAEIKDVYIRLFNVITSYREFVNSIEQILEKEDKNERDFSMYRLFGVNDKDMTSLIKKFGNVDKLNAQSFTNNRMHFKTTYPEIRNSVFKLEREFKSAKFVALESLKVK